MDDKGISISSGGLEGQQLLPGVPNEITLDRITPKLPWRALHVLSSVSRSWLHAIRTHQVYNARIRSQAVETLILVTHIRSGYFNDGIALCSMKDNSCSQLPPIPNLRERIPRWSQCISLDGKIYLLGGVTDAIGEVGSNKVFVLDLAGQRQWTECASMIEPRVQFGCGVIHGKIYVFGGTSSYKPVGGSEVYDPEENVWYPIRPMITLRYDHSVETVGEELFVHGGMVFDRDHVGSSRNQMMDLDESSDDDDHVHSDDEDHIHVANFLEVYNPVKDEWRLVKSFRRDSMEVLFMAGGKFHSLSPFGIHIHDGEENLWRKLHTFSSPIIGPVDVVLVSLLAALALGDELLLRVYWFDKHTRAEGCCLIQSRGLGSDNTEIAWQKAQFGLPFANLPRIFSRLIPIQL
ncbi:unnamed protein product [Calypogeia fissa]